MASPLRTLGRGFSVAGARVPDLSAAGRGSFPRVTVCKQGHGLGIAMRDLVERVRRALQERYDVEHEIGRGGAATVFLASDRRHGRPVALKVLHPHFAASTYAERFLREIR